VLTTWLILAALSATTALAVVATAHVRRIGRRRAALAPVATQTERLAGRVLRHSTGAAGALLVTTDRTGALTVREVHAADLAWLEIRVTQRDTRPRPPTAPATRSGWRLDPAVFCPLCGDPWEGHASGTVMCQARPPRRVTLSEQIARAETEFLTGQRPPPMDTYWLTTEKIGRMDARCPAGCGCAGILMHRACNDLAHHDPHRHTSESLQALWCDGQPRTAAQLIEREMREWTPGEQP